MNKLLIKNILGTNLVNCNYIGKNTMVIKVVNTSLEKAGSKINTFLTIDASIITANGSYGVIRKSNTTDLTIYIVDAIKGTRLFQYNKCA